MRMFSWLVTEFCDIKIKLLVFIWQKQPPEVFHKKGALENFAKLARKHLCLSLFFNKFAGLSMQFY